MPHSSFRIAVPAVVLAATASAAGAQVTQADYVRAAGLSSAYTGLVIGIVDAPVWLDDGRFWYRRTVSGGHTFVLVDPSAPGKADAFDHTRLSATLTTAMKRAIAANGLPFSTFRFAGDDAITFLAEKERTHSAASRSRGREPLKPSD